MTDKESSREQECAACRRRLPSGFRFCGFCGASLTKISPAPAVVPAKNERRDVAILFADVSGFTAMCETMDPEDVFTLMNEVFTGLGQAISAEGGRIDKYIGDNVMALFGAPIAHEDDPARACRAALGMQDFLNRFARALVIRTGIMLKMRIGINCGLVLAGSVGSEVKREYSVLGDTVNLASRLESKAPIGGILISEAVARRATGFELGPAQELMVKGKTQPVKAFELIGRHIAAPFPLPAATPLIGRDDELSRLEKTIRRRRPPYHVLHITGDPGFGKTRLIAEALDRHPAIRGLWVTGPAEHGGQPFDLIRRWLHGNLPRLSGDSQLLQSPDACQAFLASLSPDLHSFLPALRHLLLPSSSPASPPDHDAEGFRRTLEAGLALLIKILARRFRPLTVVVDSWDTADLASTEVFQRFVADDALPFPLITAARRTDSKPFEDVLALSPLTAEQASSLLTALLSAPPSPDILRESLDRAAGNPLFLEEFARWITEQSQHPTPGQTLPPNVRALIASRLDRLDAASRDFLSVAAIQGTHFDPTLAADAAGIPLTDWKQSISTTVCTMELAAPLAPTLSSTSWTFHTPLIREVCYGTMMVAERKRLHRCTAEALLAAAGGDESRTPPEALAEHLEHSEDWPGAVRAAARAAKPALDFGMYREARDWLQRARCSLERLGPLADLPPELAFPVFHGLAYALLKTGETLEARDCANLLERFAVAPGQRLTAARLRAATARILGDTETVEASLQQGVGIAATGPDPRDDQERALLFIDFIEHLLKRGRLTDAEDLLARLMAIRDLPPGERIQAATLAGKLRYAQGKHSEARDRFEQAYQAAAREPGLSDKARTANNLGNIERDLGRYPRARRYFREALALWEKTGDAEGIAGANNNLGNLAMSIGDFSTAERHHLATLNRWKRAGNLAGTAMSLANLGILALEREDGRQAVASAREALELLGSKGQEILLSLIRVIEADGLRLVGASSEAEKCYQSLLQTLDPGKFVLAHAGAQRGLGCLSLGRGDTPAALAHLRSAVEMYSRLHRRQEANRTRLWLAEALERSGEPACARQLLEEVRNECAAMKAIRDLKTIDQRLEALRKRLGQPVEISRN
jgi:class 3 adenylate cyclase/tetratricopeptide (TPR) repeat protein